MLNEVAPGDQLDPQFRAVCAATLIKLMAPLAPHLSEEWWEHLGFGPTIFRSPWPTVDESALPTDSQTIAVQINGKLRGQVIMPSEASEDDILTAAKSDERVEPHLDGKTIVKAIHVAGRLVNIVVR